MPDSFDPFDLPSAFDPLRKDSLEPTGQSASSRHGPRPHRRREVCTTATAKTEPPVNPRLAHLLPQAESPATDARPRCTASDGADASARLASLEHEVAILTARLDDLQRLLDDKLDSHHDRLLCAVASLVEQRRPRR